MLQDIKYIKKRIVGVAAIALAAVVAGSAILNSTQTALAANPTLPGVDDIRKNSKNTNTFVILEIVPDKAEASLGFLVGGEEPVDESSRSIKDMPSRDERVARFDPANQTAENRIAELGIEDAVTFDVYEEPQMGATDKTVEIRGDFIPKEGGDYGDLTFEDLFQETVIIADDGVAEDGDPYDELAEINESGKTLYREHASYRIPEDGEAGNYSILLRKIPANNKVPGTNKDLMPYEIMQDVYNNQYFVTREITDETELEDNDMIFRVVADADGGESLEFEYIYDAENPVEPAGEEYVIVEEADGDNIQEDEEYYYIYQVAEIQGDGLAAEESYVAVNRPTNGYKETGNDEESYVYIGKKFYIMKEEALFSYLPPDQGTQIFDANYARDVYQTVNYNGGFTNEEWFKKYVLDLETVLEFQNMSIDVVTATMDELTTDLVESADLLYIAGVTDTMYEVDDPLTEGVIEGLTEEMAEALFTLAKNGVPTVINRSVFEEHGNLANYELIRKLAAALIRKDLDELKAEGVTLADRTVAQWENTMEYNQAADGTLTFVKDHLYVHDDWADNGKNVVFDGFYEEEFNENQIEVGFEELIEEIEDENFYLEVAGQEDLIPEEATVATAIRHILNSGKRRNVTKTALRVLDIEPYDFEAYYQDWHDGNRAGNAGGGDGRMDILQDLHIDGRNLNEFGMTIDYVTADSITLQTGANGGVTLDKTKWITDYLAPQFAGREDELDVDIMGTKEFIGKLDDLNAEYDLIYLGMDTSMMNAEITGQDNVNETKNNNTIYNDTVMNGLIYSHIGDLLPIGYNIDGQHFINGNYRLSGNDITADKMRELKEYIEAGYAVVLSDQFLVENEDDELETNAIKVDVSSNMYKLIQDVVLQRDEDTNEYLYYGKNVVTKAYIENATALELEEFNRYLGISKLYVEYEQEDMPNVYDESNGVTEDDYIPRDINNVCHLDFEVKLVNDAAVGVTETTYDCQLFVDIDADGRYEENEILSGITVVDADGDVRYVNEEGHFELEADETYRISRELPQEYTGFISWKILFNQNGRTYEYENQDEERSMVRSAVSGFSAVKALPDQVPTINILQITTDQDGYENHLDLDAPQMHELYEMVTDFNIEIDQINAGDYIAKEGFQDVEYLDYLNEYDMLVLGFADSFRYGDMEAGITEQMIVDSLLAIRAYTVSGKSVMFTHDLNQSVVDYLDVDNANRAMGWYANQLLRDIQGMDRFGWLQAQIEDNVANAVEVPNEAIYHYESVYDEVNMIRNNDVEDTTGLASPVLSYANYKNNIDWNEYENELDTNKDIPNYTYVLGETARRATTAFKAHLDFSDASNVNVNMGSVNNGQPTRNGAYNSYVQQINQGQITEYPYKIEANFPVTHTHPQYLQLNMDTNSRDANTNDDIVVWYTLTDDPSWDDSYYRAVKNDVRNTYFIYNKGNVTYTGSGDTKLDFADPDSVMEQKLFVNTLVAAYRTGVRAPRAEFKENEWESSATIETTYEPYDPQMDMDGDSNSNEGDFVDNNLQVYFYTSNVDLSQSSLMINAKYYTDGTPEDHSLYTGGVYYKEIYPVAGETYRMVETEGVIAPQAADSTLLYSNAMYTMQFTYGDIELGDAGGVVKNNYETNIYVRLGYNDLDNLTGPAQPEEGNLGMAMPSTESMEKLHVMCTQLFELR